MWNAASGTSEVPTRYSRPRRCDRCSPRRSAGTPSRTSPPRERAPAGSPGRTPARRAVERMTHQRELHERDIAEQVDEPRTARPSAAFGVEHAEHRPELRMVRALERRTTGRLADATTSTASSSVNPSGEDSCGTFGVFASRSAIARSASSSCGSSSLSSADTFATASISRCFSSPCAPPISLPRPVLLGPQLLDPRGERTPAARRPRAAASTASASVRRARPDGTARDPRGPRGRRARLDLHLPRRLVWTSRPLVGWPASPARAARTLRLLIHDALALEDRALLDDERLRCDVAVNPPAAIDLGPALHDDRALESPDTETFCARMSASTALCGDSITSPSALTCPLTWPSMRSEPAETTVPSSFAP